MPINVVALINATIADAEGWLADSVNTKTMTRHNIEIILNAVRFIETELKLFAADDGMIYQIDRSKGRYSRTSFALVSNNVYILRFKHRKGLIKLSNAELERVERIERNITLIKEELDSLWSDSAKDS